ncbi:MAG: hypothetical protein P1P82_05560 [Bacteroidales bacterium]|nr:hypothetical protein [Bacteroidales bacterium]MDT8431400.1 hypothetical protein [Bacteroidales bacterium]
MELLRHFSLENRYLRHGIFWMAWVAGFTFVKSFGSGMETYVGWLFYYLATLPIFMAHTYLVVYWAARKFLCGVKIILFVFVFVLLMLLFSFLEMFVTNTWLSQLFPSVFSGSPEYRDPLNVLISGIGNLYIILVFAAARMVRSWYLGERKGQALEKQQLFMERADANAGILPGMLLFSVRSIEQMGRDRPGDVAGAIAMLSQLLNAVMQAHKSMKLRLDEEMRNVRNLLKLYSLLMGRDIPVLKIEQCSMAALSLPAFMIFSPLEIVIRHFMWMPDDTIEVCIRGEEMVTISLRSEAADVRKPDPAEMTRELDLLYPGRYQVRIEERAENLILWISEDAAWSAERRTLTFQGNMVAG